jgi:hypothetical protein
MFENEMKELILFCKVQSVKILKRNFNLKDHHSWHFFEECLAAHKCYVDLLQDSVVKTFY